MGAAWQSRNGRPARAPGPTIQFGGNYFAPVLERASSASPVGLTAGPAASVFADVRHPFTNLLLGALGVLACSRPSAPPASPSPASESAARPEGAESAGAESDAPKGCACRLKLRTSTAAPVAEKVPVSEALPSAPFDFERRSACVAPVCRLDAWLPDRSFAVTTREGTPSQGAIWLETLADQSTLVLPPSAELEALALVLEGRVSYGEGEASKAPGAPVLAPWNALRAPNAGFSLGARGGKASVLIAVLSRDGTLTEAIERGLRKDAAKPEKAPLEVADLSAAPKLSWGGGTHLARVAFGARDGQPEGASLSLLSVSARAGLQETVYPGEWEHLAVIRGSGDLALGNANYPARAGALFHVPPGTWHGFRGGGEDLVAISIFSPGGPERRYVEAAAKEGPRP
jgi:quercetin dioxygenase-like cupin family protein